MVFRKIWNLFSKNNCYPKELLNEEFVEACSSGNTEKVIELRTKPYIDIHYKHDRAFRMACQNEHIDIINLLLDTTYFSVDVHALDEYAFRWAASLGRTSVINILLNLKDSRKIDVNMYHDYAFRMAC